MSAAGLLLSRATIRRVLFVTMAIVAGMGLLAEVLRAVLGLPSKTGFVPMFSLSYEQNLPTWYASTLLFACSLLLAAIALFARRTGAGHVRRWWLLAGGFLYISLDETACIHEEASHFFDLGGVLFFGWVIPAGILVVVLGVVFLRFLAHLPKRTRVQFIVAGGIYVVGAVVLELPLGHWTEREGSRNFVYGAIDWLEESMEILGVTLFLLSLVEYMEVRGYRIGFAPEEGGGAREGSVDVSAPREARAPEVSGASP